MKTMTNLSLACKAFSWAGGTIHQVADELGIPGKGNHLALMPRDEFSKLGSPQKTMVTPIFATLNLDAVGGLHKSIRRH